MQQATTESRSCFSFPGVSDNNMWVVHGKASEYAELLRSKFPDRDLVVDWNDGIVRADSISGITVEPAAGVFFTPPTVYIGFSVSITAYPKIPEKTLSLGLRFSRLCGFGGEDVFKIQDTSPKTEGPSLKYQSVMDYADLAQKFWEKPNFIFGYKVSAEK